MKLIKGYTLLESLVVLSIMGIMAGFSYPSIRGYYARSDAKILKAQTIQLLQRALNESQSRFQAIGVRIRDNKIVVFLDSNEDGRITNSRQIIQALVVSPTMGAMHWRSYPHYRNYLQFTPDNDGEDNGTFWYCLVNNPQPAFVVTLNKLGVIGDKMDANVKC